MTAPFFFSSVYYLPELSIPPLSVTVYISFLLSSYCQPCHLPIARLPRGVLTLGFFQICSLQAWKVVMRAKKNSLALSLTTRLVFLMKPNENSIFFLLVIPSHPPSLPHSSYPAFTGSGAFKLMTNFSVPV
ncbi:hypothetical protein AMECASPLE_003648 [Ameca splendens]